MVLNRYNEKRDFGKTPEPSETAEKPRTAPEWRFVVQRHNASRLHYDLRLEINDTLKSWAVPKGPSMNPEDKRLAVMVEDHPVSYLDFEGIIPKGNYGAGTVEIWDSGTYEPQDGLNEQAVSEALEKGNLKFRLSGKKLKGGFDLVKIKNDDDKSWLLIKRKDDHAVTHPYSSEDHRSVSGSVRSGQDIRPMLARVRDEPFDHPDWLFEVKWDGYRTLAEVRAGCIELYSRKGLKVGKKYISIVKELEKLKYHAILDGELVVLDEEGHASFQDLQHYEANQDRLLCYYAFDLLYLEGRELYETPLKQRKEMLKEILPDSFTILYSDHITGRGKEFFEMLRNRNIEGMMAKHAESPYRPGRRSEAWLKIKWQNRQDAVIGGFTEPKGSRKHFGSLVLGIYKNGKLRFAGHSGGGFSNSDMMKTMDKLKGLVQEESPFGEEIETNTPVTWVKPDLVCELSFTEWTSDGRMRHPKFLGFRPDKNAGEVVRENENKINMEKTENINGSGPDKMEVDGYQVPLTNQDKIYWPDEGYTKGELVAYYNEVAEYILPYLRDRPESLHRHPNGINEKGFFQKDIRDKPPSWIRTISIYSESANKEINYLLCQNKASLIYLANLGCIELNPWNSRVPSLDQPDYVVIDIDPDGNPFTQIIDTALTVKGILDEAKIQGFCKTSGSSGLHVYIPLGAKYDDAQARNFAHIIAQLTHERIPGFTSMERSPKKRKKKIYLDYLQNKTGQTLAAPYSVRPKPGATVSTPVHWSELRQGIHPSMFTIKNMAKRLEQTGDLFKPVLGKGIDIGEALSNLGS